MSSIPERNERILNMILVFFTVLFIVTTVVLLLPAWRNYRKVRAEEAAQQNLLDEAKLERQKYLERRNRLKNSPAEIEKVAREDYNFVRKGEIVMSYPAEKKKAYDTLYQAMLQAKF